jgi:predicted metal-dependent HD superfamily phosphohydrolase
VSDLDDRWPALLADHTDLRDRLVGAYAEPHRGYHDGRHLAEVLDRLELLLDQHGAEGVDRDAVVLAAWFHDAVYDGRPDDVERSVALAETELAALGVPEALVREVARLVRLTLGHRPDPQDLSGQILCDADLAILASDAERYREYVAGVRREYAHLDDATFREGRAEILRALLAGPALFHTAHARAAWEAPARANVEREVAELSRPGSPGAP